MKHLEAVIRMLAPTYDIRRIAVKRRNRRNRWFKRGTMLRAVSDVLNIGQKGRRRPQPQGYPRARGWRAGNSAKQARTHSCTHWHGNACTMGIARLARRTVPKLKLS